MRTNQKLHGKSALITGGEGHVCLAIARRLANEGAYVFIIHRGDSQFAAEIDGDDKNITLLQGDPSNPNDLSQLLLTIERKVEKVDIIVTSIAGDEWGPFGEVTQDRYDGLLGLQVKATLLTVGRALQLLVDGGSIIFNLAITSSRELAGNILYGAAKAAVLSFSRALTKPLEERWIRVNAVSSGGGPAPQTLPLPLAPHEWSSAVQLDMPGTAYRFATAVVSLLCDDATEISGAELTLERGATHLKMLSDGTDADALEGASLDKTADAILYLASEDSRRITGMHIFLDDGMIPL